VKLRIAPMLDFKRFKSAAIAGLQLSKIGQRGKTCVAYSSICTRTARANGFNERISSMVISNCEIGIPAPTPD
jgi:hypothetical protein